MHLNPKLYSNFVRPKFSVKRHIENVLRAGGDFAGKSVLDFACGTGDLAYLFDSDGYLGVDTDAERTTYASTEHTAYNFVHLTDSKIPANDNQFDLIIIVAGIHHIDSDDFRRYVPEFARVLKSGGRILGIEPCKYDAPSFSNWYMDKVDNGKFIRTFPEYQRLFQPEFQVQPKKYFRKFIFYREVFYEGRFIK